MSAARGAPPVPWLSIMGSNAFLLSAIYLAVGVAVELLLRFTDWEPVRRLSVGLDALPARLLDLLGLLPWLRGALVADRISPLFIRATFSAATLLIIFLLALLVGVGMFAIRWLYFRFGPRKG